MGVSLSRCYALLVAVLAFWGIVAINALDLSLYIISVFYHSFCLF